MNRMVLPEMIRPDAEYTRKLDELFERRGAEFADNWSKAQPFLQMDGRVRKPPSGWSFVNAVEDLAPGQKPEFTTDKQRADWAGFWSWYLPVESNLLKLSSLIRYFAKHDQKLCHELCLLGHQLEQQYRDWTRDGSIPWLPKRPPNDRRIIDALGSALIDCSGPAPDYGDPGPHWEPMP